MNRIINSFNTDSLKGRLRFFILNLLLFVVLVISVFLILTTKSQLNETYTNELKAIVKMQSQAVEKWLNERELDIKFLASNGNMKKKEMQSLFESFIINQSEFYSISHVNSEGYTILDSTFENKDYFGDEPFFLDSLDGVDTISKVTMSKDKKMPIIYFSSPIFDEYNEVKSVIVGAVRLSSIQSIVEDFRFSQTGETFIINKEHQLLTKRKWEQNSTNLKIVNTKKIINGFYMNYIDNEVLGAITKAHFNRWTIVAQISKDEIYKVFKEFILYIFVFILVLLMILIPLILSFSNKIEKPLKFLLYGSKQIENGDYGHQIDSKSIVHSTVEIRELTHSFNNMSDKLSNVIKELKITSTIDVLSQLNNRRELLRLSQLRFSQSKDEQNSFTILMIDIDFFKKVNDNYGHQAGDVVISNVANTIKTSITSSDIAGRYGGEEFLVCISNTNELQVEQIAQRIRKNIEKLEITSDENILTCTCSIGVCFMEKLNYDIVIEDIIEYADQALYEAKHNGRNQVVSKNKIKIIYD